jgi:hypothetical protein
VHSSGFVDDQSSRRSGNAISLDQVHVLNDIQFDVADSWKTIGHFFKDFAGNAARLAKLRREL